MTAQAIFTWHDDRSDQKKSRLSMVTAVVQLSQGVSAMRVWGFEPSIYWERGACKCFLGGSVHESVPWKESEVANAAPVRKVAFFLQMPWGSSE